MHKKIEDLSFGNRKKAGIVQALLHEPKLLILDEPTGGLDPLMQHTFFELLLEERKKGVIIFFSSHILSGVQKLCDRVAIIKEGKLIQVETVEHLKYVSPFKYVDAAPIINELQIDPLYMVLMIVIISVSIVSAYVIYQKKDIVVWGVFHCTRRFEYGKMQNLSIVKQGCPLFF